MTKISNLHLFEATSIPARLFVMRVPTPASEFLSQVPPRLHTLFRENPVESLMTCRNLLAFLLSSGIETRG